MSSLVEERARLARDLHDQLGSRIAQLALLTQQAPVASIPSSRDQTLADINATTGLLAEELSDAIWLTKPSNDTLASLVSRLGDHAVRTLQLAGIRCNLDFPLELPECNVPTEYRRHILLAHKEALTNLVRHSGASRASVRLRWEDGWLTIEIQDDGRGFEIPTAAVGVSAGTSGNGLQNMRERLVAIGGTVVITSSTGHGTSVTLRSPLPQSAHP